MSPTTVLNTRPVEQAGELSRLLREAGFTVVEAPAIAVVAAWAPADLQRARQGLRSGEYAWVVLASANAGRELLDDLSNARIVCGRSTARALGLDRASIALQRFSAAAALSAVAWRTGDRVLIPRADEGRDELIDGLRALHVEVDAPVAYRTVAVDAAARRLNQGGIDAVTLCSPSAVRSVAGAIPPGCRVVCLGDTTAAAARELGLRPDAVAQQTSMPALVDAVVAGVGVHV
jgi:uroporphyrinogen III methyltransferase / synthase